MMKSSLIKLSSALVMLLYLLTCVGIGVHVCSCTGNVCVAPAFHYHDEHGNIHMHRHHGHDCNACDDAHRHEKHDCCHDEVFRLGFAGEESRDVCILTAPDSFAVSVIITPCSFACGKQAAVHAFAGCNAPPPHCGDILENICIMRV